MRNLIDFLFRNGVFLVFILLEIFCFYLVVKFNGEQSEIYHSATASISGSINDRVGGIVRYWNLDVVNDSLRAENAQLRRQLASTDKGVLSYTRGTDDSSTVVFNVIPAKIIQNSIGNRNNYLMLNKGTDHGLRAGLGVTSGENPIGIVVGASRHYSRVMSVLHGNAMISASIRGKGYFGSLIWRGFNPGQMELDAIPKHAQLYVGDTVVTSGYSQIFPSDMLIGTIDTFWLPRGSNFYRINVDLFPDMSKIRTAYIYDNMYSTELDSLENGAADE